MAHILIVDDEDKMRHLLSLILQQAGHQTDQAGDGRIALEMVKEIPYDMVISDIKMPRMTGPEMLQNMKSSDLNCPVVFITAFATVESAVAAMRIGAADYITKPFDPERILLTVERTLKLSSIMAENRDLKAELFKVLGPDKIICVSNSMDKVISLSSKVAKSDSAVLIVGESGTGKELIAQFIHQQSARKSNRFVPINCAAISPHLVESEMFGHEKGSFTGAEKRTQGKFEFATEGTLFLDEIGDLSLEAQAKLLRAIQEKKIQRVGGNDEVEVNVRLVCATNRNLSELVEKKLFRQDLFYRVNVFPIELPPLRERKADIVPLCRHFLEKSSGRKDVPLTDGAIRIVNEYGWPGNVRELVNAMERVLILSGDQGGITAEALGFLRKGPNGSERYGMRFRLPADGISIETLQRDLVRQAMAVSGNNQTLAAELLGLTRAKFRVLLKNVKEDELKPA